MLFRFHVFDLTPQFDLDISNRSNLKWEISTKTPAVHITRLKTKTRASLSPNIRI